MMMLNNRRGPKAVVISMVAVLLLGSICGCTTLRRKFVRKSKAEDSKDGVVPVLQPEEYKPHFYSPIERYRECYSMLKGYFGDLWNTLGRDAGGKREQYLLSQIEVKLNAMADLLPEEPRAGLQQLALQVQRQMKELDKAHAMRRYDIISSDLKIVERDVRRHYKPELVAKFIK